MLKRVTTLIIIIFICITSITGCKNMKKTGRPETITNKDSVETIAEAPSRPQIETAPPPDDLSNYILFENNPIDLGTLEVDIKKQLTFKFKNTGKEDLIIKKVQPTCTCLSIGSWDNPVKPGETGRVDVSIDTKNLKGRIIRIVNIETNAPGGEKIELRMEGHVFHPVEIASKRTWLGEVTGKTEFLKGSFSFENNLAVPLVVKKIISPDEQTTVNLVTIKKEKSYRLDFTVKPPFKEGEDIRETIKLITSSDKEREFEFIYSYMLPPPIQVNPKSVVVDLKKVSTKKFVRRINIKSNIDKPIDILDPQVSGQGVQWSVDPLSEGKFYQIPLVFPVGFSFPENEKTFYLTFKVKNDPNSKKYTVPLTGQ